MQRWAACGRGWSQLQGWVHNSGAKMRALSNATFPQILPQLVHSQQHLRLSTAELPFGAFHARGSALHPCVFILSAVHAWTSIIADDA
jgi:hypothetical protein